MTDENKDLTSIVPAISESPASAPGEEGLSVNLNTEVPPETVQNFESLEDFAKSSSGVAEAVQPPSEAAPELAGVELAVAPMSASDAQPDAMAHADELPPEPIPVSLDPATSGGFGVPDSKPETPTFGVSSSDAPPPTPNQVAQAAQDAQDALENVRRYSEAVVTAPAVPAAYPFSLAITGPLAPEEKARLLDLLSRENMGIREVDLEPQFEAGRILIPRISEYAGVLLVQALRGARARMRLYPSDSQESFSEASIMNAEPSGAHPAESLPITQAPALPQFSQARTLETVTASAALSIRTVEAQESQEFQDALESLKRELRYRAFRKGACGIVSFSFNLASLSLPTRYRLTVSGDAIA